MAQRTERAFRRPDILPAAPARRARRPLLPRLHLLEFHEEPWCPEVLRRFATDYLHMVIDRVRIFAKLTPTFAALLRETGELRIVDLCSGGTGPIVPLLRDLREQHGLSVTATMTDLYPNLDAFARAREASGGAVEFRREPIDARRVPEELAGIRTIFDGFHHFRPDDARAILADAAAQRAPILIAEAARRTIGDVLGMALLVPPLVLLAAPLVRPRTFARFALTYIAPLSPLLIAFDGVVSCLRAYSVAELEALTAGLSRDDYAFEVGEIARPGGAITYLIGRPRKGACEKPPPPSA
jgi:hypothetical protein